MKVKIPVNVIGSSKGVKRGGIVEHFAWDLEVKCLPMNIPENITVDISDLDIGEDIYVKDIPINEKFTINESDDKLIIGILGKREEEEVVAPEESVEEAKTESSEGTDDKSSGKDSDKEDSKK